MSEKMTNHNTTTEAHEFTPYMNTPFCGVPITLMSQTPARCGYRKDAPIHRVDSASTPAEPRCLQLEGCRWITGGMFNHDPRCIYRGIEPDRANETADTPQGERRCKTCGELYSPDEAGAESICSVCASREAPLPPPRIWTDESAAFILSHDTSPSSTAVEYIEKSAHLKEVEKLREALVNEITFDKLKPVIKSNAGDNPIDEFTLSLVVTKVRKLIRAALRASEGEKG